MANLFAQASANWNAANQWNTVANGSGSFVTPGTGDVCMANGKAVTINVSPSIGEFRNDTTGGATTGGTATLSTGVTLTCSVGITCGANFITCAAGTSTIVAATITSNGGTAIIVSNATTLSVTGNLASASSGTAMNITNGSAVVTVTGNLTAAAAGSCISIATGSGSRLTLVGNTTGASAGGGSGIVAAIATTVSITGTVTAGTATSTSCGLYTSSGVMTASITGAVNGSSGSAAAVNIGTNGSTLTVATGPITGGSNVASPGVSLGGTATATISCAVTGGTAGAGLLTASTATNSVTISSAVTGGAGGNGVHNTGTGIVTINANVTGGSVGGIGAYSTSGKIDVYGTIYPGAGATGWLGMASTSSGTVCLCSAVGVNVANGVGAITGNVRVRYPINASNLAFNVWDEVGNIVPCHADSVLVAGSPSPSDVRYGVSYQLGGQSGTCYVPAAASVLYGVNVDATTGTATISASDIRAAVGLASANLDTQLSTIAGYVDTEVAAIKAKTDNLPSDPADESLIIAATDAIMTRIGAPAGASIAADIAALPAAVWAVGTRTLTGFGTLVADVWAYATRVLTAGTNIVLAKGTGLTGLNDIAATDIVSGGAITTGSGKVATVVTTEQVTNVNDKTGYELSAGERSAIQGAVRDIDLSGGLTGDTLGDMVRNAMNLAGNASSATNDDDWGNQALKALLDAITTTLGTPAGASIAADIAGVASGAVTADQNADALLDRADSIEVGLTLRQAMRLVAAAQAGKLSGAASSTNVFRNAVADDKDRITATVDGDGNRTAIAVDLS